MLRNLLCHGLLNVQVSSQGLTELGQVPMALDPPEPRLNSQQRRGQPPLPLIRVRPAIHLGTPLFHQGINGFQTIRRFEGQTYQGKHPISANLFIDLSRDFP
jgi:hypothetical protein